jgi:Amt family ammonium transporter
MKRTLPIALPHRFYLNAIKPAAWFVALLCLLACLGCSQSADEGGARSNPARASAGLDAGDIALTDSDPLPEEVSLRSGADPIGPADRLQLEVLDESVEHLERRLATAHEGVNRNASALRELRHRLGDALAGLDAVTARLDPLAHRMSRDSEYVESQRSWLENQAGDLFAAQRDLELAIQRITDLEQSLQANGNRIDANTEAIAGADARWALQWALQKERLDALAQELAPLVDQLQQHSQNLEQQGARLDANGARIFETLMALDSIQHELAHLQQAQQRVERALEAQADQAEKQQEASWPGLLPTIILCLLVPLAIVFDFNDSDADERDAAAERRRAVGTLAAWFGGGAGYYLVGIGIMFGSTLGGIAGAPTQFLADLLQDSPVNLPTAFLNALLLQLSLAAIVAVVVCSVIPERIPSWAYLFAALLIGAIVYPLFGHWTAAPSPLSEHAGWLTSLGFSHPPAAPDVALLGGATALFLSGGLLPLTASASSRATRPDGTNAGTISAMLLWLGWIGVIGAASNASPNAPLLLIALAAAASGAAFSVLILSMAFSSRFEWLSGLPFSVLAALVAAPGGVPAATLTELILLGALTGFAASVLMAALDNRLSARIKLAAALMSGGLLGTLAPALFGPTGFVFTLSFEPLIPQIQGIGVALVLALIAGQTLAWTLNRTTKSRAPA